MRLLSVDRGAPDRPQPGIGHDADRKEDRTMLMLLIVVLLLLVLLGGFGYRRWY